MREYTGEDARGRRRGERTLLGKVPPPISVLEQHSQSRGRQQCADHAPVTVTSQPVMVPAAAAVRAASSVASIADPNPYRCGDAVLPVQLLRAPKMIL